MTSPFCSTINDLPEISFIAGDYKEINFIVYTSGCTLYNLTDATIAWKLAPFGQRTSVLTKNVTSTSPVSGEFKVVLGADTIGLGGKYNQQYTITDSSGSPHTPSQGIVNIIPIII